MMNAPPMPIRARNAIELSRRGGAGGQRRADTEHDEAEHQAPVAANLSPKLPAVSSSPAKTSVYASTIHWRLLSDALMPPWNLGRASVGRATFRMLLSSTITSRLTHSTANVSHRRCWTYAGSLSRALHSISDPATPIVRRYRLTLPYPTGAGPSMGSGRRHRDPGASTGDRSFRQRSEHRTIVADPNTAKSITPNNHPPITSVNQCFSRIGAAVALDVGGQREDAPRAHLHPARQVRERQPDEQQHHAPDGDQAPAATGRIRAQGRRRMAAVDDVPRTFAGPARPIGDDDGPAGSHQDRRRHSTPRTTLATTQSTWIWRLFPDWVSSS